MGIIVIEHILNINKKKYVGVCVKWTTHVLFKRRVRGCLTTKHRLE
jgi:hypothetical protein